MEQIIKPVILKFESEVIAVRKLTDDVKEIILQKPADFSFVPGQFITLILQKEGKEFRRSYSIASKDNNGNIELCIKILKEGQGTSLIDNWNIGEIIKAIGPLGKFVLDNKSKDKDIVFVSTGTGITPFRSMIYYALKHNFGRNIFLVAGYKNEADILYDKEFKQLATHYKNFSYHAVLSRSVTQEKKYVQDMLEEIFNPTADYYICGLKDMIFSVRDLLLEKGVPQEQIFFERYD